MPRKARSGANEISSRQASPSPPHADHTSRQWLHALSICLSPRGHQRPSDSSFTFCRSFCRHAVIRDLLTVASRSVDLPATTRSSETFWQWLLALSICLSPRGDQRPSDSGFTFCRSVCRHAVIRHLLTVASRSVDLSVTTRWSETFWQWVHDLPVTTRWSETFWQWLHALSICLSQRGDRRPVLKVFGAMPARVAVVGARTRRRSVVCREDLNSSSGLSQRGSLNNTVSASVAHEMWANWILLYYTTVYCMIL